MSFPFVPLEFTEYPPEEMLQRASRFYAEMRQRRTVREFPIRSAWGLCICADRHAILRLTFEGPEIHSRRPVVLIPTN